AREGRRSQGLVGHGRDGGAGASAPRTRRSPVHHVGPERRRLARPRTVRSVVPALSEAALARRGARALLRQAALAPRVPPPAVARADQPADLGADLAARNDRVAHAAAARRGAAPPALRRALHPAVGGAGAEGRPRRAP